MKKKVMIPLADKENKSYEKQKVCYICKKQKKGYLNLMSVSSKVMMEKVIRVIFLKWMSSIQKMFSFHSDLPFLPERKKIEKCNQLVCDFHEKKNYVVHIKALKQALNHGLILKKCIE